MVSDFICVHFNYVTVFVTVSLYISVGDFKETRRMPAAKQRCEVFQIETYNGFIYIHEFSEKSQTEAV